MKLKHLGWLLLSLALVTACTPRTVTPTATLPNTPLPLPSESPIPVLPTAAVLTTSTPDPGAAARAYLDSWTAENYPAMYAALTGLSRDAIKEEDFTLRYQDVANEAALESWSYEILAALVNSPYSAQVNYRITLNSRLVGKIQRETVMNLSLEEGRWQVQWDEGLILPELRGGNYLKMEYNISARANIYDRDGKALVAQADAVAIGLNASEVSPDYQTSLLRLLQEVTGVSPAVLEPKLEYYRENGQNWYLPVGDVSAEKLAPYISRLTAYTAVQLTPFRTRYYFDEGIAPHVVGYMSYIQKEEVDYYQRLGYAPSERVGRAGLELWGEPYLAGTRGGRLYVVSPDGAILNKLAETAPTPSQSIYTTLDRDFQKQVQYAIDGFRGAVVVIERDTGRVLAMASAPKFNPNLFEPANVNYSYLIEAVYGEDRPTYNRASQGQYPLGSVFKIITMAAALKSSFYTP
jgi:penicillin-binding protein 2